VRDSASRRRRASRTGSRSQHREPARGVAQPGERGGEQDREGDPRGQFPQGVSPGADTGVLLVTRDAWIPQHPGATGGELGFLARVLPPEVDDSLSIDPHLLALVELDHPARLPVDDTCVLGCRRIAREARDGVDPAPGLEDLVGVDVVRLPQRPGVRRDRGAADLHLVAHHPGSQDEAGCGDEHDGRPDQAAPRAQPPPEVREQEEGQKHQARVPEDRKPAERAEPCCSKTRWALGDRERREHERGS